MLEIVYPDISSSVEERYLNILGIEREKPGLEYLNKIVKAHLFRIPFENISKIYYKNINNLNAIPDIEFFIEGIEKYNFGGTCYTNNYYLNLLLNKLGFNSRLCGADMLKPDVHMVTLVKVENKEYIVDVGYGAPFSKAIERNLRKKHIIEIGNCKYEFNTPDKFNKTKMNLFLDGMLKHGYIVKPEGRKIDEFKKIIANSYNEDATFMNSIILAGFSENKFITIRNMSLVISQRNHTITENFDNKKQLGLAINKHFKIPKKIISKVLISLNQLKDTWSES